MARAPAKSTETDERPSGYVPVDIKNDPMSIWNNLRTPDPRRTKTFQRAGGFKGTAIAPMHLVERMTQMFGPCGLGWGFTVMQVDYVPVDKPEIVNVLVDLWWVPPVPGQLPSPGETRCHIQHAGGTALRRGERMDDEALKAAVTDAIGKAASYLGMSADVHLGLFDDNKYVKEAASIFTNATEATRPSLPVTEDAAEKVDEAKIWEEQILAQIAKVPVEDESMPMLKGIREGALAMYAKLGDDHPAVDRVKTALADLREKIKNLP